jgi:cation transport ATPase
MQDHEESQVINSRHQTAESRYLRTEGKQQTADSRGRQQTTDSRQQTAAHLRMLASRCQIQIVEEDREESQVRDVPTQDMVIMVMIVMMMLVMMIMMMMMMMIMVAMLCLRHAKLLISTYIARPSFQFAAMTAHSKPAWWDNMTFTVTAVPT